MGRVKETLWQHWTKNQDDEPEPEFLIKNILNLRVGQFITIDILDHRDKEYSVQSVEEHCREIGMESFYYNEYRLSDHTLLRIDDEICQLFRLHDSFEFDEGFLRVIHESMDSSFNMDDEGIQFAPSSLKDAIYAKVTDHNMEKSYINIWVYKRDAKDEANQTFVETLNIIQDNDTGWFEIWRGIDIDRNRIIAL